VDGKPAGGREDFVNEIRETLGVKAIGCSIIEEGLTAVASGGSTAL
jgi:hypothetical protein